MPPYIDSLRWEVAELEKTIDGLENEPYSPIEDKLRAQLAELYELEQYLTILEPTEC